jgi:hypothetical protein
MFATHNVGHMIELFRVHALVRTVGLRRASLQ